jgi:uncharacterized protein (DUF1015 family)
MAALAPFRALRPAPASAARVAAVPYDVVNTAEARALAAGNPLSFLHVSRAEIDLPDDVDPHADVVYATAVDNYARLKADAPLVVEGVPSLYVYALRMGPHEQVGVAGAYSLDEYEAGVIKKHERTRQDKEDDRTRHMIALGAQTGPVFLTYRRAPAVDAVVSRVRAAAPLFDFAAGDGIQHTIWRASAGDAEALVAAFDGIPSLYIADGHHRAASAARARRELRDRGTASSDAGRFLCVAFPDAQVQVLAYNRIVKSLNAHTPDSLLAELRARFDVRSGPPAPPTAGTVAMFLDGRWHHVTFGPLRADAPPIERLDVSRLQDEVLTPILGIGDVRADTRIDFVGGGRGTDALEQLVTVGAAAVAFSLHPVSVGEMMQVCDAGGIMPPKSTWFEPKLRDGLLSHLI